MLCSRNHFIALSVAVAGLAACGGGQVGSTVEPLHVEYANSTLGLRATTHVAGELITIESRVVSEAPDPQGAVLDESGISPADESSTTVTVSDRWRVATIRGASG